MVGPSNCLPRLDPGYAHIAFQIFVLVWKYVVLCNVGHSVYKSQSRGMCVLVSQIKCKKAKKTNIFLISNG